MNFPSNSGNLLREEIKAYFTFSQSQQRGILTLLFILLLLTIAWFDITRYRPTPVHTTNHDLASLIDAIVADSGHMEQHTSDFEKPARLTPFPFDPNTLDEAGFRRLGLRERLVKTFLNYRNKGGRFYNKQSLQRIYGLHEEEYRQLEAFIQLPDQSERTPWAAKTIPVIDINTADTGQWISLPYIGSKLAMNITQYRKRLGGFYTPEQLLEVYGISAESYAKFKPYLRADKSHISKLNLNTATYYELNAHPYLHGPLADSITALRRRHQYKLDNLQQLREIALINDEIFRKIAPYLHTD